MEWLEERPARWEACRPEALDGFQDYFDRGDYGSPGSDLWKEEEQRQMRDRATWTFAWTRHNFYDLLWSRASECRIPSSVMDDPFLNETWSDPGANNSPSARILLSFYFSPSSTGDAWDHFLYDLLTSIGLFCHCRRIHLVDFPSDFLRPVASFIETGAPRLRDRRNGGSEDFRWALRSVDVWTWYLPDGSLHSIKSLVSSDYLLFFLPLF